jgi:hypothetical protein
LQKIHLSLGQTDELIQIYYKWEYKHVTFKVKKLSLSGKKRMELAEAEMPGLMALRAEYKKNNL